MPEETQTTTTEQLAAPTTETKPAEAPAQETDWKAEARKWEERAKANKSAVDKLAEIEEASKTEAQKAAERLAAAEAKVAEFEKREQVTKWKDEVAKASGVPATVLAGSTKEEIEAHAETLKPLIAGQTKGAVGPYVAPEGTNAGKPAQGAAQAFADHLATQLGR
jgi:hypothetical protein